MSFAGVGHPDGQDQGSFTTGRVGPAHSVVALAAGDVDIWTVPTAELTNLTLFRVDAGGPCEIAIIPASADQVEIDTARVVVVFTQHSGFDAVVTNFGGGYQVEIRNIGSAPLDVDLSTETLFKSSADKTVAPQFTAGLGSGALAPAGVLTTTGLPFAATYDRLAGIVVTDQPIHIEVRWTWGYADAGVWQTATVDQDLGSVSGAGYQPFDVPVVAPNYELRITNTDAMNDATVACSYHLSKTS